MPMLPGMGILLGLLLSCAVLWDVAGRRLPGWLPWALLTAWALPPLLGLFGVGPWVQGGVVDWSRLLWHPMVGMLAVLALGHFLWRIHRVDASDVYLLTLMMLWMADRQWLFLVVVALTGGALALGRPLLAVLGQETARWLSRWVGHDDAPAAGQPHETLRIVGVPYTLAVACGVASIYLLLPGGVA